MLVSLRAKKNRNQYLNTCIYKRKEQQFKKA